ncbi:Ribosomal protein L22/L17, partial [mine drainage metagenome]
MEKKVPIKYFRYLDSVSHKRASGPGRYPVKAASEFLKALANAESNAEFKGMDTETLRVTHIAA